MTDADPSTPSIVPSPVEARLPHDRSRTIFDRAKTLMPGGVNSPARAFGGVGGQPIVFDRAEGACLYDVDGNRYVDYIGSWGPMILGHAHPAVLEAIEAAVRRGTSFGAPTPAENDLAALIIDLVPSIEKVRLVNSGTEAAMSAIRLARGATGRNKIIKFAGNYHGHADSLLVAAGSSAATLGVPNSPGVTPGTAADTIVLEYNDCQALEDAFARIGDEIACVALEPVVGNMGTVIPTPEFLTTVRAITRRHGALLLFDEVMTGFRVSLGGAQQLWGVEPDLTCLGKIVGGGMPLAAYGGPASVMDHVLPAGKVFQAGTLSGNPVACAAGTATLTLLKTHPPYERLDELGAKLEAGLRGAAEMHGVPHHLARVGSMMTLFFSDGPVRNWTEAARCDTARYARFFWELIERGIYFPCSQFEALFIAAPLTDADLDRTIEAANEALALIAAS